MASAPRPGLTEREHAIKSSSARLKMLRNRVEKLDSNLPRMPLLPACGSGFNQKIFVVMGGSEPDGDPGPVQQRRTGTESVVEALLMPTPATCAAALQVKTDMTCSGSLDCNTELGAGKFALIMV